MSRLSKLEERRLVKGLVNRHEPRILRAFIESIQSTLSRVVLGILVDRISRGDILGAINSIRLDTDSYEALEESIFTTYYGVGNATVNSWPVIRDSEGLAQVFRFGVRNNEAESWLRGHSSRLITDIVSDQREAIRVILSNGLQEGSNPRRVATRLIGRIDRRTGLRKGGIIGLSTELAQYVESARQELLSGNLAKYMVRERRDRTFDRAILAAIRDNRSLGTDEVEQIVSRYSDSLLKFRGDRIARTEMMTTLNKARDDAIRHQVLSGKVDPQDVTKVWQSALGRRTRDTHRTLHGTRVLLDEPFRSSSGALIMYPGDPGAPASERIHCRCWLRLDVDFIAPVIRRTAA